MVVRSVSGRWLRRAAALAAVTGALAALASACTTSAISPSGCREIEDERCQAASVCPGFDIPNVTDCQNFYRDQCQHGLEATGDPGQAAIDTCTNAIKQAAACINQPNELARCLPGTILPVTTPCESVAHPELLIACQFLNQSTTPVTVADAATPDVATSTPDATAADAASAADGADAGADAPAD
jgi:hypothetical protein